MKKQNRFIVPVWKFKVKCCHHDFDSRCRGINYVAKSLGGGVKAPFGWGLWEPFLPACWLGRLPVPLVVSSTTWSTGWPYRQFNRVRLPASELGLLSGFCTPWVVLVKARRVFVSAIIMPSFQLSFQRHSTSSFGVVRPVGGGSLGVTPLFRGNGRNHAPVWLASFTDEFVLDILDKVCVAYLAFFIYRQLPKRMVHYFKDDKWWLIKHLFLERHGSSSKWYQVIDPITSSCSSWTWRCWAAKNLLLQAGLILVATLLLLFSKLSSTTFKALGFSLFDLHHADHPRLFTVGIKLCCFLCLGCRSTKRAWFTPPLWVVEYWWLFWPVAFLWWPRVFQKTRPIWNCPIVL